MKRSGIFTSTFIFAFLTFLQPAISFFLLPLYLNYLSPDEYSIYSLMSKVSALAALLAAGGISQAVTTLYFDFRHNPVRLRIFMGSLLGFTLVADAVFCLLAMAAGPWLFSAVFDSGKVPFYPYGMLAVLTGIGTSLSLPFYILLKNERRLWLYGLLHLTVVGLTVLLQVLLITVFHQGVTGALWARLIATLAAALLVLGLNRRDIRFRWPKGFSRYALRVALIFSLPFLPDSLIRWMYNSLDQFVVQGYAGLGVAGLYALLSTLVQVAMMASDALTSAIQPFCFDALTRRDLPYVARLFEYHLHAVLLAIAGIYLLGCNIDLLTSNPKYWIVSKYVAFAVLSYIAYVALSQYKLVLIFAKRTRSISLYSLISVVVLLLCFVIIAPYWGIWGVLTGLFVSNSLSAFLHWRAAQRDFPIRAGAFRYIGMPLIIVIVILSADTAVNMELISAGTAGLLAFTTSAALIAWANRSLLRSMLMSLSQRFNT